LVGYPEVIEKRFGEMSQLNVSIGADLREADFWLVVLGGGIPVNQQKGEFQPNGFIRLQALWRKPF